MPVVGKKEAISVKQRNKGGGKRSNSLRTERPAVAEPLQQRARSFTMIVACGIIGLSVAGGFAMSLWPRMFGLQGSNPAIGFGLAALAAFRLYALRRELRSQAAENAAAAAVPAKANSHQPAPSRPARERG
jgi:hypothetical protein